MKMKESSPPAEKQMRKKGFVPPFTQIAVSSGTDGASDVLFGLDEEGRVWKRVVKSGCVWVLIPDEAE